MNREIIENYHVLDKSLIFQNMLPSNGLHILINKDGTYEEFYFKPSKGAVLSPLVPEAVGYEFNSGEVDSNKRIDAPKKLMLFANPLSLRIKGENLYPNPKKNGDIGYSDGTFENYFKRLDDLAKKSRHNSYSNHVIKESQIIRSFLAVIDTHPALINFLENVITSGEINNKKIPETVSFYVRTEKSLYEEAHKIYLEERLFITDDSKQTINGIPYGGSSYLSTFNVEKPSLRNSSIHYNDGITQKISGDDAAALYKFQIFQAKKVLPNPMPLFVDPTELDLNGVAMARNVNVFDKNGEKLTYTQMVTKMYNSNIPMSNFYLYNYGSKSVNSFDYVPNFRFKIKSNDNLISKFKNTTEYDTGYFKGYRFEDVFRIEWFMKRAFGLNEKMRFPYFGKLESYTNTQSSLLYKYRNNIYESIYLSRNTFTNKAIRDIMWTFLMQKINKGAEHEDVLEILNIWLAIDGVFEKDKNKTFTMKNDYLYDRTLKFSMGDPTVPENTLTNEDRAYMLGQAVYFIASKLRSENGEYMFLSNYLNKKRWSQITKLLTSHTGKYAYVLRDSLRFGKVSSHLTLSDVDNIDELMPIVLAGFAYNKNFMYYKDPSKAKATKSKSESVETEEEKSEEK